MSRLSTPSAPSTACKQVWLAEATEVHHRQDFVSERAAITRTRPKPNASALGLGLVSYRKGVYGQDANVVQVRILGVMSVPHSGKGGAGWVPAMPKIPLSRTGTSATLI